MTSSSTTMVSGRLTRRRTRSESADARSIAAGRRIPSRTSAKPTTAARTDKPKTVASTTRSSCTGLRLFSQSTIRPWCRTWRPSLHKLRRRVPQYLERVLLVTRTRPLEERLVTATAPKIPTGFDPTDPDLCQVGIPLDEFTELRRTAPVFWVEQEPKAYAGFENTPGFWALSKHADVAAVSKNSKDWSSHENGAIIRFAPDMTRDQVELQ